MTQAGAFICERQKKIHSCEREGKAAPKSERKMAGSAKEERIKKEGFGFYIDDVVDHRAVTNKATLGMVNAVVSVGGKGLLGGVSE